MRARRSRSLCSASDYQACYVRTDVASENVGSRAGAERCWTVYGQADILVNNATIIPLVSVADMEVAQWDRAMAVNLRGTFLTCRGFLPCMLERGRGVIINMVSLEGDARSLRLYRLETGHMRFLPVFGRRGGRAGRAASSRSPPGMVDTPGMRSISDELSDRLGFNQEQFYGLSLHPAYDGFMPLDHAGAATAYLAAVLADEYHGEVVNGYTILERAGTDPG